jgi:hypothetical protein
LTTLTKKTLSIIASGFLLAFCGCQQSQAEKLYRAAYLLEQQNPYDSIQSYYNVIAIDADSPWAQKAQGRIDVLLQRKASRDAALSARRAADAASSAHRDAQIQEILSK